MFRRFSAPASLFAISTSAAAAPSCLFSLSSSSPLLSTAFRPASTLADMVTKLREFQKEYTLGKSALVKQEAAELIEKEVLIDAVAGATFTFPAPPPGSAPSSSSSNSSNDVWEQGVKDSAAGSNSSGDADPAAAAAAAPPPPLEILTGLLARPPQMSAGDALTILSSASMFGVQLHEPCHAVSCAVRWCVSSESDNTASSSSSASATGADTAAGTAFVLDAPTCAKIIQSMVAMQHPQTVDVLVSWIKRLQVIVPATGDAASVVALAHGYGRSGTIHQALIAVLEKKAIEVLRDTQSIAQVANAYYAFAQLGSRNRGLYAMLAERAVALLPQASPIVIATIIDSLAVSGIPQPELVAAFEPIAAAKMADASAPLVASLMLGFARVVLQREGIPTRQDGSASVGSGSDADPVTGEYAVPTFAAPTSSSALDATAAGGAKLAAAQAAVAACPVIAAGCARVVQIGDTFDPASVAKLLQALVVARIADENILTQLADRVVVIAETCKVEEVAMILRSIAQFELYDDTLFNTLARRVMTLMRGGRNRGHLFNEVAAAADQVASVLCSFAMVSQPHSDLFAACSAMLRARFSQLSSADLIDVMWAYLVLGEHLRHGTLFSQMQEELKRRVNSTSEAEVETIRKHPRYESAIAHSSETM